MGRNSGQSTHPNRAELGRARRCWRGTRAGPMRLETVWGCQSRQTCWCRRGPPPAAGVAVGGKGRGFSGGLGACRAGDSATGISVISPNQNPSSKSPKLFYPPPLFVPPHLLRWPKIPVVTPRIPQRSNTKKPARHSPVSPPLSTHVPGSNIRLILTAF